MVDTARQLRCVIVSPEKALLDAPADFVAVPLFDGEAGFLPGRAPLIGRLGTGELRLRRGGATERFYVDGGFVQVKGDVVTVLTAKAIKGSDIDANAANQALQSAGGANADARARAQQRARAQLRIARHASERSGISLPD